MTKTDSCDCNECKAVALLRALKRGSCWCEMGIGNPMYRDHSVTCEQVQKFLKSLE